MLRNLGLKVLHWFEGLSVFRDTKPLVSSREPWRGVLSWWVSLGLQPWPQKELLAGGGEGGPGWVFICREKKSVQFCMHCLRTYYALGIVPGAEDTRMTKTQC